ncbi:PAS domain-containing protein [Peptococcaceae bacterium 1198_IL3148]
MTSIKINTKIQIALLMTILVSAAILLHQSLSTPSQTEIINHYSEQLAINAKVSEDIGKITSNSQMYILYADKQYLDAFRYYSAKIIEDELALYNNASEQGKESINKIIELSKTYISFVENEVVPLINAHNELAANDLKYLQVRHNEFSQELQQRAAEISSANMAELNNFFQGTVTNIGDKITLPVMFLLISLLLMLAGLYGTLTQLSSHHQYLNKVSENIENALIIVDRSGVFKELNKSAREILGIDPDKLLEKNISEIPYLFPQLQNIVQPLYAVIMQKKELLNQSIVYIYAGKKIALDVDYHPVLGNDNKLIGVIVLMNVVAEQRDKHVLLDTLEAERKRLSIEIHDWIAQYLSTIIHSVDYIIRLDNIPKDELKDSLVTIRSHCQNAAIEMRGIMNNLHPYLIDKVGLVSALESYINTFEKLNNIKVYVFYQTRSLNIPNKLEIIIYRIIQEALSNIVKHSQATEVNLHFIVESNLLKIELEDNGGDSGEFVTGKGMWGMKERAKLIGGDIDFEHSDIGFCVTLTVPIDSGGHNNEQNHGNVD